MSSLSSIRRQVLTAAAVVALAATVAPNTAAAYTQIDLRVDANRDGRVDLTGGSDSGSDRATALRGALFLPNLDDDGQRCATRDQQCSDASDQVVNGAADVADLAMIKSVPQPNLGAGVTASVTVDHADKVNLFRQQGRNWTLVTDRTTFDTADLRAGIVLGLEGKDIVRDSAQWDGTVTVTIRTNGGDSDRVQLRVAPMLTHHHGQTNEQVLTSPRRGRSFEKFARDLGSATRNAKVPNDLYVFANSRDQWTQDWVEPMYVSMPTESGSSQMRLMLRSDQSRSMQNRLYELRGKNLGVVQISKQAAGGTRNSFGNLETIPPHQGYPAGRIILGEGRYDGPSAATKKLLSGQGAQDPLMLDTGWLNVGHVDEFVQFVPANNQLGFVIAVADPLGSQKLLQDLSRAGHGRKAAGQKGALARKTIDQLLGDRQFQADQKRAASAIEGNISRLKRATGATDAEVIRIPGMYAAPKKGWGWSMVQDYRKAAQESLAADSGMRGINDLSALAEALPLDQFTAALTVEQKEALVNPLSSPERLAALGVSTQSSSQLGALYPMAVNGIVANNKTVIVPKQWGPVINGQDALADAVAAAYRSVGYKIIEVDDYDTYHVLQGEVHCGSNSLRTMASGWWSAR